MLDTGPRDAGYRHVNVEDAMAFAEWAVARSANFAFSSAGTDAVLDSTGRRLPD